MSKLTDAHARIALLKETIIDLIDGLDGDAFVLGVEGPRFTGKMKPLVRVLGKNSTAEWVRQARDRRDLGIAAVEGKLRLNKKGQITYKERQRAIAVVRERYENR